MSIHKFINIMKMQAAIQQNGLNYTSVGSVTAYDPLSYSAQVQLLSATDDEPALQTGWLPIGTIWMGNGWGMFSPPNIGDLVAVHFQEGNLQNAFIGVRLYNQTSPPLDVTSGEMWLVHSSGSYIKLTNDGKLSLNSTVEINVTAPIVNIDSAEVNLGNGTLSQLMTAAAAAAYDSHTHIDSTSHVTSGPSNSIASYVTSNTNAS